MTVIFKWGVLKLYTSATSEINECLPLTDPVFREGKAVLKDTGMYPGKL